MKSPGRWPAWALAALAGCSPDLASGPADPASISLERTVVDLFVTEVDTLRPVVLDASGVPVATAISWSSSDGSVAAVRADGVVTATGPGEAQIRAHASGVSAAAAVRVAAPLTALIPIEGQVGLDYFMNHYVAHAGPGGDPVDFQCGLKAPEGHQGTDFALTDFEAMRGRVTVRAAAPGTVVEVHDGEPNFSIHIDPDAPPNRVVIDHGDGLRTVYENLWEGTLQVQVGDGVLAGAPLGLVGSSGGSWVPHLHFEVWLNERIVDPFSGPCAGTVDQWNTPAPYEDGFEVLRARVSDYQLQTAPHLAVDVPAAADTIFSDRAFVAWAQELNAEINSRSRIRLLDPLGRVRHEADRIHFSGPRSLTWFGVRISALDEAVGGTWTMEYLYEDVLLRTQTFEMVVR